MTVSPGGDGRPPGYGGKTVFDLSLLATHDFARLVAELHRAGAGRALAEAAAACAQVAAALPAVLPALTSRRLGDDLEAPALR